MQWTKMTLGTTLIFLLAFLIFSGFNSYAQTNQTLDLTQQGLQDRIQASGYINSKPIRTWGSIVGTKDPTVNLTEGEVVYLKIEAGKEVKPGDRFVVVREAKEIIHPMTKKKIGRQVVIPGILTILQGTDRLVTAKIVKSYQPIYQGDLIIPSLPPLFQVMPIRTTKKIEGTVVASPEDIGNITEREFIFLDRGSQDGVTLGELFSIYQVSQYSKEAIKNEKGTSAMIKVGEAVVISVQEDTSTAFVTHSYQSIFTGDKVISGRE